jgi:hypothetical protein
VQSLQFEVVVKLRANIENLMQNNTTIS